MEIKKEKLIKALEEVKPGLGSKDIVEQSTSFAFMDGHVVTFNDMIAVRYPIDLDIEGAVRANELYALLSKIKEKKIDLKVTKNELQIKGEKFKGGIKLEAEIRLPLEEMGEYDEEWIDIPKGFIPAIKLAAPCAAADMSKPILTCVHIEGRYVEATNDFLIIKIDMGKKAKKSFKESLEIPASAVRSLIRYPVEEFCLSPGWVHFRTGEGCIFSCRTFADGFPDISHLLDIEGPEVKLPTNVTDLLEKAGIFTEGDSDRDEEVLFSLANKKLTVRGEGDYGWFEEETRCPYTGEDIQFSVSPAFLYGILDHLRHCVVGEGALKFEGDNYEYVVCLAAE